jgi:hypothetical protein
VIQSRRAFAIWALRTRAASQVRAGRRHSIGEGMRLSEFLSPLTTPRGANVREQAGNGTAVDRATAADPGDGMKRRMFHAGFLRSIGKHRSGRIPEFAGMRFFPTPVAEK